MPQIAKTNPSTKPANTSRTQRIVKCALLCALLIVSCFITIPLGPIPFTLQTAVVMLIALTCAPGEAAATAGIYLLMGAIGLPVFSGMTGGIIRASSGFLLSYVVGSAIASGFRLFLMHMGFESGVKRVLADIVAVAAVIVISDIMGWLWIMFFAHMDPFAAFLAADAPFVFVDCCKGAVCVIIMSAIRKAIPGI